MTPEELLAKAGENISVRRVFGEPIERDGTTVIPVALVLGGAGGGYGTAPDHPENPGAGGGYGIWARGIGLYTIREGRVKFVPTVDATLLALTALLIGGQVASRLVRRSRKRRHH